LGSLPTSAAPVPNRALRREAEPIRILVSTTYLIPKDHSRFFIYTERIWSGTSEPKFQASGNYVYEHDFAINVAPDTIRDMLSYAIDEFVRDQNVGRFVTDYLVLTEEKLARRAGK